MSSIGLCLDRKLAQRTTHNTLSSLKGSCVCIYFCFIRVPLVRWWPVSQSKSRSIDSFGNFVVQKDQSLWSLPYGTAFAGAHTGTVLLDGRQQNVLYTTPNDEADFLSLCSFSRTLSLYLCLYIHLRLILSYVFSSFPCCNKTFYIIYSSAGYVPPRCHWLRRRLLPLSIRHLGC